MIAPSRLLSPGDRARWWNGLVERGVPAAVTLVLTVAMTVPVFASVPVLPHLALLGVFVWASFQPGLMPPWLAFVLGGVADLLFALPLGISALLLPATVVVVRRFAARFGPQPWGLDWLFATAVIVAFEFAQWQLLALTGTRGPFAPLLAQAATTAIAYPGIVLLFAAIQRRMQAHR